MVLSFHPNIVAHQNILCAGRRPNKDDEAAIGHAQAVILPQGPGEALYRLCRAHCPHVFPNYDARYDFPGKLGQTRLFQKLGAPFPVTVPFDTVADFRAYGQGTDLPAFPYIFKSHWGGEGDEVFLVDGPVILDQLIKRAEDLEKGGQRGFLIQELVPHGGRSLRVVIIGSRTWSYWRTQPDKSNILSNLRKGARLDHESDPQLQDTGKQAVARFCAQTGINLAGFDLLFPSDHRPPDPLFLEINYFFGRRGLGGSVRFYSLFEQAVTEWLAALGLAL